MVLRLQVARGHVRVGLDSFGRVFPAALQIVLVDDSQGESVQDGLLEIFVNHRRMVRRNQTHLFAERKVKIENTTLGA